MNSHFHYLEAPLFSCFHDPSPCGVILYTILGISHINNAANAVSLLHVVESRSNVIQRLAVGDELIDLELTLHVIINQSRKLAAAFDTTERTALPDTASDKLECYSC